VSRRSPPVVLNAAVLMNDQVRLELLAPNCHPSKRISVDSGFHVDICERLLSTAPARAAGFSPLDYGHQFLGPVGADPEGSPAFEFKLDSIQS